MINDKLLQKLKFSNPESETLNGEGPLSWKRKLDEIPVYESREFNPLARSFFFDEVPKLHDSTNAIDHNHDCSLYFSLELGLSTSSVFHLNTCYYNHRENKILPFNKRILELAKNKTLKFNSQDRHILNTLNENFPEFSKNDFSLELTWEYFYELLLLQKIINSFSQKKNELIFCEPHIEENPLSFCVYLDNMSSNENFWKISGHLLNSTNNAKTSLWDITALFFPNIVLINNHFFSFRPVSTFFLLKFFQESSGFSVKKEDLGTFLAEMIHRFGKLKIESNLSLSISQQNTTPTLIFYLNTLSSKMSAQLWFRYEKIEFPSSFHQATRADGFLQLLKIEEHFSPEVPETLHFYWASEEKEREGMKTIQSFKAISLDLQNASYLVDQNQALSLIYRLLEQGIEVWAENIKVKILNDFCLKMLSHMNWFEISLEEMNSSKQKIEAWQLIHLLKKRSLFLRLDDGSLGILPESWMESLENLFKLSEDGKFSFGAAPQINIIKDALGENFHIDEPCSHILENFKNISSLELLPESTTFKGTLRLYQKQGVAWLSFLDKLSLGGLLADEMGLGKTVQVLAFLDQVLASSPFQLILLITPKSLMGNWKNEIHKFCPHFSCSLITTNHLTQEEGQCFKNTNGKHLFIISYGLLRRHISFFEKIIFDYIFIDEAQIIKNPQAQVSMAIKSLNAKKRIALSATPIENHIGDLLSIFDFLNPGLFSKGISHPSDFSSAPMIESLFGQIRPLVLRRLKREVLTDLPDKQIEIVTIPMHPEQDKVYQTLRKAYQEKLHQIIDEQNFLKHKPYFLEGLLRLKQIATHPYLVTKDLVTKDLMTDLDHFEDFNKLEFLRNKIRVIFSNEEEHKILIFSQFVSFLTLIKRMLNEEKVSYEYLDGQSENRQDIVENFQTNKKIKIFLISLRAGGLGLNLTSADYAFIMDPWWNPAIENQAIDRLHRIGQTKKVFISKMISENSIDEKILKLHVTKIRQAEYLEATPENFFSNFSFDEIKNLFS